MIRASIAAYAALLAAVLYPFAPSANAQNSGMLVVKVAVESTVPIQKVCRDLFGLNTAAWDNELGSQALDDLIKPTGARSFRYPGGSWADSFDWTKPRWQSMPMTREFGAMLDDVRGDGSVIVNYGSGTPQMAAAWAAYCDSCPSSPTQIGADSKGVDWKTAGYWASLRSAKPLAIDDGYNCLRADHLPPYPIRQFEVGNECYGSWEADTHLQKQDPVLYAQFYAQTRALIKKVASNAAVGAVITAGEDDYGNQQETVVNPSTHVVHSGWTPVVLSTLYGLGVIPDFVILHYYPQQPSSENDAFLLQASHNWKPLAESIRTMLGQYCRGRAENTRLECTENNSVTFNPGKQSTSLVDGLYYADSFGSIEETEFRTFDWWCLHGGTSVNFDNSPSLYGWRNYGDYGILSTGLAEPYTSSNTPYPVYRTMQLITHFCAPEDEVLLTTSNNALVSAYAVRRLGGTVALMVINKSPAELATVITHFAGFRPGRRFDMWTYGKAQDTAQSKGDADSLTHGTFSSAYYSNGLVVSPYSIVVLVLPKAGA